jgi:predicted SAM-dependent methyltransferase
MKLHIGSRIRMDGWKTFNIEAGPEVDYVGNLKDLSQFPTASIDTIYASHCLEHISYLDLKGALKEWNRVLKPGAPVMISVPDLETLCQLFLKPSLYIGDRFRVMQAMFGGHLNQYDYHCVGLNLDFLGGYLLSAGFVRLKRVDDFHIFNDTSRLKIDGVPISLNVTALKPS